MIIPTRELEKNLLIELESRLGRPAVLAGVDEVGRGAIAGPVSVGIALVTSRTSDDFPEGLRDSKQISAVKREQLVPECRAWVSDSAVGHADASIVDSDGIIVALRKAAAHALDQLSERGWDVDAVLLDGKHNWWYEDDSLFAPVLPQLPVTMKIKGDASCAVVAAASVLAKVERDTLMMSFDKQYPGYDWATNKGYGTRQHSEGLRVLGVSPIHRRSWNLPGLERNYE